jgi:hypothetical protein
MSTGNLWSQVDLSRKLNEGRQHLQQQQIELADQTFQEGAALAYSKGLPCWELQFEAARVQIPLSHTFNQHAAVMAAAELAKKSRQPQYDICPERVNAYDLLVQAYFRRDCLGYETEIRVAAAYIDEAFSHEQEIRLRLEVIRAEIDLEFRQYAEAQHRIERYLATAAENGMHPSHLADGYRVFYKLAYARGKFLDGLQAAKSATLSEQEAESPRGVADSSLAQALFAKHLGNDNAAQQALQRGLDYYQRYNLRKTHSYYDPLAAYYELDGDPEASFALRREQLEVLSDKGNLQELAKAHLQHIRLCGRLQKPLADPVQAAYFFREELRNPAWFTEHLEAVLNGNYWEFPWQAR